MFCLILILFQIWSLAMIKAWQKEVSRLDFQAQMYTKFCKLHINQPSCQIIVVSAKRLAGEVLCYASIILDTESNGVAGINVNVSP